MTLLQNRQPHHHNTQRLDSFNIPPTEVSPPHNVIHHANSPDIQQAPSAQIQSPLGAWSDHSINLALSDSSINLGTQDKPTPTESESNATDSEYTADSEHQVDEEAHPGNYNDQTSEATPLKKRKKLKRTPSTVRRSNRNPHNKSDELFM